MFNVTSASAIRSSSTPASMYKFNFAKAPLSDSMNSFIVTRPSRFNLSLTNKLSLAHHRPEASSSPPLANVMTEAPVETASMTTEAPTTTMTPQMITIHPGRRNVLQVNIDIVSLSTAAQIANMLKELARGNIPAINITCSKRLSKPSNSREKTWSGLAVIPHPAQAGDFRYLAAVVRAVIIAILDLNARRPRSG